MEKIAQRFVLERQIGSGGMARVYLGRDEVLHRPVAVKVLEGRHASTEIAERFRREGRTAARLSHPNVVQVYDAGEADFDGRTASYIVMEYLPGGDLKALVDREGPLPSGRLAALGSAVASGLEHAHEHGVVHRDIKPHNVLLDAAGRPKLSDFGIARALDATQATGTGAYLGTALYSAPEQLRGRGVTPKSDVYSLGVALYQALTGNVPFAGTPIEVASQHISAAPPPPSAFRAGLDAGLEEVILDCLEKDPDRRPSAGEVADRLSEVAARERTPAPAPSGRPRTERAGSAPAEPAPHPIGAPAGRPAGPRPSGRRRRVPALLAALVALSVLLGAAGVLSSGGPWGPPQNPFGGGDPAADLDGGGQAARQGGAAGGGGERDDGNGGDPQPGAQTPSSEQPAPSGASSEETSPEEAPAEEAPAEEALSEAPPEEASGGQAGGQEGSSGAGGAVVPEEAGAANDGVGADPDTTGTAGTGGAGPTPVPEQEPASQQTSQQQQEPAASGPAASDPEAAAETVRAFYDSAAAGDYDTSASLLTGGYRASTWPSESVFENTFGTLERVEFTSGPSAEVSGGTATVSFSTIAYHTDRTERKTGTATLVLEGGGWKIDSLSVV